MHLIPKRFRKKELTEQQIILLESWRKINKYLAATNLLPEDKERRERAKYYIERDLKRGANPIDIIEVAIIPLAKPPKPIFYEFRVPGYKKFHTTYALFEKVETNLIRNYGVNGTTSIKSPDFSFITAIPKSVVTGRIKDIDQTVLDCTDKRIISFLEWQLFLGHDMRQIVRDLQDESLSPDFSLIELGIFFKQYIIK